MYYILIKKKILEEAAVLKKQFLTGKLTKKKDNDWHQRVKKLPSVK